MLYPKKLCQNFLLVQHLSGSEVQEIFVFQYVWAIRWGGVVGGCWWVGRGLPKKMVAGKTLLGSTSILIPKKFSVSKNLLAKGGNGS